MGTSLDLSGLFRGYLTGFGEGSQIQALARRYSPQEVTGPWADVGRQLGQIHGQAMFPTIGLTLSGIEALRRSPTFQTLMELASRLGRQQVQQKRRRPTEAYEVRRRQGPGWWQADIGEEEEEEE